MCIRDSYREPQTWDVRAELEDKMRELIFKVFGAVHDTRGLIDTLMRLVEEGDFEEKDIDEDEIRPPDADFGEFYGYIMFRPREEEEKGYYAYLYRWTPTGWVVVEHAYGRTRVESIREWFK